MPVNLQILVSDELLEGLRNRAKGEQIDLATYVSQVLHNAAENTYIIPPLTETLMGLIAARLAIQSGDRCVDAADIQRILEEIAGPVIGNKSMATIADMDVIAPKVCRWFLGIKEDPDATIE